MGRLYDRQDLRWNLAFWDRQEQALSAAIANGQQPASVLDTVIHYEMGCNCNNFCGRPHFKHVLMRESFELSRKRERMKLLRTGMLLSDLSHAQRNFDACTACHLEKWGTKTKTVECETHRPALKKAKSAVYWAGERNLAERQARGQLRAEGVSTAQEATEGNDVGVETTSPDGELLNTWEEHYYQEKREGYWPGGLIWSDRQVARGRNPADELAWMKEQYGSLDYRGYLQMLLQEEEISPTEYSTELKRLRDGHEDVGLDVRKHKRDTRYNALSA